MNRQSWLRFSTVSLLLVSGFSTLLENQPLATAISSFPPSAIATQPTPLKSGTFIAGEHPTTGRVRLVTKNGKSSLEFDRTFKTSEMGPDLVVILHRSANILGSTQPPAYPLKRGDYVIIAPLKQTSGVQSYSIPDTVKLSDYKSVAIWCRKFNATFGAATLK